MGNCKCLYCFASWQSKKKSCLPSWEGKIFYLYIYFCSLLLKEKQSDVYCFYNQKAIISMITFFCLLM